MKKALVLGSGGFIGGHLTRRLKSEGYHVTGVDIKHHEFDNDHSDEFVLGDLRNPQLVDEVIEDDVAEIYQLAADMGGAGFVFTGENDADIMHNSALINLNVTHVASKKTKAKVFYSSSACIYPERNQLDPNNPISSEDSAYPAAPDSEYGWEKLFSERLYLSFLRNKGLDIRIARFHNIFGPKGTWQGGREKAPAAMCRKVVDCCDGGTIQVWGDGRQTRSFLYVDECVEGVRRLMNSEFIGPVNIGSEEMVTIDRLAQIAIEISGKKISIEHVPGPQGVRGRSSDNELIHKTLNWKPSTLLVDGMFETYHWIKSQREHKIYTN